jgi:hypothetical protein
MNQVFSDITIDSPAPEVAHEDAEKYWQWLWPALELGGSDYTAAELATDLLSGDVLLVRVWADQEFTALACCRVRPTLDGKELFIMGLVGEKSDEWLLPLSDTFDKLASEAGCVAVVLEGRPGWSKKLRGLGYTMHQVVMRKPVKEKGNGQSRIQ